jgi:hypothetical protein
VARGPGSSVGIATDYGLDGPGIESSGFGGLVVSVLASGTQHRGFAPDRSLPSFGGKVTYSVPCPSFGACKRTQLSSKNCEITGQIPLVPSLASAVRCVSGQYAAFSGGEGGKFLGARVYWLSSLSTD